MLIRFSLQIKIKTKYLVAYTIELEYGSLIMKKVLKEPHGITVDNKGHVF